MASKTLVVQVFRGKGVAQAWRWRLRGRNGEIMLASEGYAAKSGALRAARRLKAMLEGAGVEKFVLVERHE